MRTLPTCAFALAVAACGAAAPNDLNTTPAVGGKADSLGAPSGPQSFKVIYTGDSGHPLIAASADGNGGLYVTGPNSINQLGVDGTLAQTVNVQDVAPGNPASLAFPAPLVAMWTSGTDLYLLSSSDNNSAYDANGNEIGLSVMHHYGANLSQPSTSVLNFGNALVSGGAGDGAGEVIAYGAGFIARSADIAGSWNRLTINADAQDSYASAWAQGNVIYVAGQNHVALYRSTDTGNSWTQTGPQIDRQVRAVCGSSASDIYVVGDQGLVAHSTGDNFTIMNASTTADLYGCLSDGAGNVFVIGRQGIVSQSADGGKSWAVQSVGYEPNGIFNIDGLVYLPTEQGRLLRNCSVTSDSECPAPTLSIAGSCTYVGCLTASET